MISRSQKNEKSSPPPRESLSGGGCQLILDLIGQIPLLIRQDAEQIFYFTQK